MSKAESVKEWVYKGLTPCLMLCIGYLLNDKLETIDRRLSAVESLQNQITTNTAQIGFLQQEQQETKNRLDAHLAAILPDEIKVKKERSF